MIHIALCRLLLALCVITLPAYAQVYKWIDAKGRTQYGDTLPESARIKAEVITATPGPSSNLHTHSWEEKDREFRRRKSEQSAMKPKEDTVATSQQICAGARQKIRRLDGTLIYRLDQNGERVYMEDGERAAIEKQAKQDIANHCPR